MKYSLTEFILNGIEGVVDTGHGVPTEDEIEGCEGGKFVIGLILQILKEKNRSEQAKSFVLSLVDEVNGRASRYGEEISESNKNCDTWSGRQYRGHYEGIKVSIMAILQALSDRNMVECEKLFIDKLDSTIKIEMKNVFSKDIGDSNNASPELPIYNNPGINDSSDANYLRTLKAMEICKLLEYAYINKYNFIIQNLLKNGNLLSAIRESGHFCYYVCMLPTMITTKEYKSVRYNFSNFERFKIWLYRLAWRFFSPKIKISVKPLSVKLNKNKIISDNIKNNLEYNEVENITANKDSNSSKEI